MNIMSRTITGITVGILGIILVLVGVFVHPAALIYGLPIFIIGLFIFFNKQEDEIEQIKEKK